MADVKQIELNGTILDIKDATARADISTLSGVVSGKVPDTRTVNGKALSTDITLTATDIGYNNVSSGLTATTAQAAVDEIAETFERGQVNGITASSTQSLYDLGVLSTSQSVYLVMMHPNSYHDDVASVYIVGTASGTPTITTIKEGAYSRAPILDTGAVLKLVSSSTSTTVYYTLVKIH